MQNPKETNKPLPMAAIVYLAFEPAWLALSRKERGVYTEEIGAILVNHPKVTSEWFDADALAGGVFGFRNLPIFGHARLSPSLGRSAGHRGILKTPCPHHDRNDRY
ncbi:MAG: hypothetical protein ABJQ71_12965 [Roseibium sp.]